MKVSEYIVSRLNYLGVDTAFLVTGGGAMHLNDAVGAFKGIRKIYTHHEQGAAIAAEAYARLAKKPALLNVTTGPGGVNALNGVFGAYTDSIPMVVVSGQVKRETLRDFHDIPGLRQLGDQEVNIIEMVKPITKWRHLVKKPEEIPEIIDRAFIEATTGRCGPVWVDVPVDVQGMILPDELAGMVHEKLQVGLPEYIPQEENIKVIIDAIFDSKRPVILAGTGVRLANSEKDLIAAIEKLQIPVTTAWTHDIIASDHPLFAGRPGTIGTRAGNFVVQNADLVIILGSRLNIRQVSYNWQSFARNAKKIWVDIDSAEFRKPYVRADVEVVADLKPFLAELRSVVLKTSWIPKHSKWVEWCQKIKSKYTPSPADYPVSKTAINPYHFVHELFENLESHDIVVCGDATATIVPYQIGRICDGMRLISNSGSASMGYDIPAALGAAIAKPDSRIICLAGDGSSMMNIQELQTICGLNLNIVVFILNNDGYLSIKQTQKNFFGRESGTSSSSGLSFPDFVKLGKAFGFKSSKISSKNWKTGLKKICSTKGPVLCEVMLELEQEFEPRLKSRMQDGKITTPELEDMYPFLDKVIIEELRREANDL